MAQAANNVIVKMDLANLIATHDRARKTENNKMLNLALVTFTQALAQGNDVNITSW